MIKIILKIAVSRSSALINSNFINSSFTIEKLIKFYQASKIVVSQKFNYDQGTHLTILIMNIRWKTVRHFVFIQKHFDIVR